MADRKPDYYAVPANLMEGLSKYLASHPEVQLFMALRQCPAMEKNEDGNDTEAPETE